MLSKFKTSLDRALSSSPHWEELVRCWTTGEFPLNLSGPKGAWATRIFSKLAALGEGPLLIITPNESEAMALEADLSLYGDNVSLFPWWGTMLYRGVSPQAAIFGRRATVLAQLASEERRIVVASLRSALGLLPPPQSIRDKLIHLKVGGAINPMGLEHQLQNFGYSRVPRVSVPGEFALRGEVLDLSPLGEREAVRIVFAWDAIEEIRLFDIVTQISLRTLEEVTLHPLKEVIWEESTLSTLRQNYPEDRYVEVFDALESDRVWRGEELFYPLAYMTPSTLQDYLPKQSATVFIDKERLEIAESQMIKEYSDLYRQSLLQDLKTPPPERLITDLSSFVESRKRRLITHALKKQSSIHLFDFPCEPGRSFFGNISFLKEELGGLADAGYEIFVFAESESQSQRIGYLLKSIKQVHIGSASISGGFHLPDAKILVIQENEIFGRRKRVPASLKSARSTAIDSFVDLEPGDLIVHINYGIGRFRGIKRIKTASAERDYISLVYADDEKIFIPIEQVNLVQRYIGQEGREPRLDRIGSPTWEKKKKRVKKSVADLAERLIHLYAKRQIASGYAFPKDDDFQISFEAAFPWQETEDQLTAIADVKTDMEKPTPMDRLVCGDVGYGKTEIAMRATFKAVMGGRQVVYLCPTTILAEQHHESFNERFKRFPVSVGMLSRFIPSSQIRSVLKGVSSGDMDVVIGTHRILSKDVSFKNLGLIIIDEEQRFGVRDKEKLKELKASVDCLTLSATPIPRTLHMSLVKIRDMTLLETPPRNRQPIETFIQNFDATVIARAIRTEVERGGQAFYLHNRIESLERIQQFLRDLIPEILVEIAHGQMLPRELEDIMHRFVHGAFQVLVSTTIIENGIDIPNVNTIIIDRADMHGISQLYQLRGRVGRSGRLAYAYLMYPEGREISELAMKRLQIISDFTELGSGFKIAMKDLEVRGAGNLLGAQQSGDVYAVGFDLYIRLLEEAIQQGTAEDDKEEIPETYLELDYSGFIPDSYIDDESEKMEVYKKIAAVENDRDLGRLYTELHDRFGPLPDELHSLVSMAEIRIICRKLRISHLKEKKGSIKILFGKLTSISVDKVMNLIKMSEGRVKLNPHIPEGLLMDIGDVALKEKSAFIRERLETLL